MDLVRHSPNQSPPPHRHHRQSPFLTCVRLEWYPPSSIKDDICLVLLMPSSNSSSLADDDATTPSTSIDRWSRPKNSSSRLRASSMSLAIWSSSVANAFFKRSSLAHNWSSSPPSSLLLLLPRWRYLSIFCSSTVSRILGPKLLRQLGQWSEVWNVFSSDATVWSFVALIMDSRQERQQLNWQYCEEHWMGWDVSYGTRVESERHRRHSSSSSFSSSNTFSLSLS